MTSYSFNTFLKYCNYFSKELEQIWDRKFRTLVSKSREFWNKQVVLVNDCSDQHKNTDWIRKYIRLFVGIFNINLQMMEILIELSYTVWEIKTGKFPWKVKHIYENLINFSKKNKFSQHKSRTYPIKKNKSRTLQHPHKSM